jgi:glutamyl-tRNA reductase
VALAAELAGEALGGIDGRSTVVIGAGTMAELAVHHLRGNGAGPIRILNRSLESARMLGGRTGADHGGLQDVPEALAKADLIVSATGAAGHLIARDDLRQAAAGRAGRSLVVLDLAGPRDVEPGPDVDGVQVFDVLALRERIGDRSPETADEVARAQALVADEVRRWQIRRRGEELAPLIRAVRERGDAVVRAELDRWASALATLEPEEREAVEALARGVAAKLLHDPIVGLKDHADPDRARAKLVADLFGLDPDE